MIEVFRYRHFISGGWAIAQLKFSLTYRIFILVDNIFYNPPRFLHIVFISCQQFMIILLLGSNQCPLEYSFIWFITSLIMYRVNPLIFVIQFIFYFDWIPYGIRQPRLSIIIFLFYLDFRKTFIQQWHKLTMKYISKQLCVPGLL